MKVYPGVRKALSLCLTLTIIATYSMVTLANAPKLAGELRVTGKAANGSAFVLVNGESANTGRSIFSSSNISTPEGVTATLNLGKAGVIEVAPNSSVSISFDSSNISGTVAAGAVKVIAAQNAAQFVNATGQAVLVNAGETAAANGKAQDDDDDNDGGSAWILWALVVGGAAAGFIWAATSGSNDISLGGGGTIVSPTR